MKQSNSPHVTDHSNDLSHPSWAAAPPDKHPVPPAAPHHPPQSSVHRTRLTFSVQRSTHLSTDMLGMAAVTGKARERLSGLRKQPRKTALPSGETEGKELVRCRLGEPPSRQESRPRSRSEPQWRLMS